MPFSNIVIFLTISLGRSIITFYPGNYVVVEKTLPANLATETRLAGALSLINLDQQIVTYFSTDLAIAYQNPFPKATTNQKWSAVVEDPLAASLTIVGEEPHGVLSTLLRVVRKEKIRTCSGNLIHTTNYLLYSLTLDPVIAELCGFPKHDLALPAQYSDYEYVFRHWAAPEPDGAFKDYNIINTEILPVSDTIPLAELLAVPIVSEEEFFVRTYKSE